MASCPRWFRRAEEEKQFILFKYLFCRELRAQKLESLPEKPYPCLSERRIALDVIPEVLKIELQGKPESQERSIRRLKQWFRETNEGKALFQHFLNKVKRQKLIEKPVKNILENNLIDYLSRNIKAIEANLEIVERQKQTPMGRIDILAKDGEGNLVAIELKAGLADEKALTQLASYIAYLKETTNKQIKGYLIANNFTQKVKYAAKLLPNIKLLKYKVKFDFEEIQ